LPYSANALTALCQTLLQRQGMDAVVARDTAEVLVEGDLLGHSTHGLQLLPRYLEAIGNGALAMNGSPSVVSDHGASFCWDGGYLPGAHLMRQAITEARTRLATAPVVTVVLRRSGHIGCLAAYPLAVAEAGLMMVMCSSDPAVAPVAPHGATEGVLTPNPIAAGWPTEGDPVVLDVCPSSTTAGMVGRAARTGTDLSGAWLIGADGVATNDPSVLKRKGGGAILPLGGRELGHKGFALALLVEALTMGLGGFGRADGVRQEGAAVFFQLIDPGRFGGGGAFRRETGWVADASRGARPMPGGETVRMPGARGIESKRRQLENGVTLHPDAQASFAALVASAGLVMPPHIGS
jgi:L-lactate dehydrogenase